MNDSTQTVEPVNELGNEISRSNPFSSASKGTSDIALQAGTASAVAREEAEMKAAIFLARQNPRDEHAAYSRVIASCNRARFAETALYRFPRGGSQVEGPSVDLAREMARCWGNIRYGLRIVTNDRTQVHIKGYAIDLETNNYVEAEDKFEKLIQRKNKHTKATEWIPPDERDLRELVNRRGAICVRNALLQLMPPDVVDDAIVQTKVTIRKAAEGDLGQDRVAATRRMVMAFQDIGVTTDMLAKKIGNALDVITGDQLAELRVIYKSIIDKQATREEHFMEPPSTEEKPGAVTTGNKGDDLAARIKAEQAAKAPKAEAKTAAPTNQDPPMTSAEDAAKFQAAVGVIDPTQPPAAQQGSLLPPEKATRKR